MLNAAGFLMIALGLIGLVLPIMPTIPFLLAGVALLGRDHPVVRPFIKRLDRWRKSIRWKREEEKLHTRDKHTAGGASNRDQLPAVSSQAEGDERSVE